MNQDPWVRFEDLIREQLSVQVELSFDRHHRFMLQHGLSRCSHVTDIGTGNGLFLSRLAERHPEIAFTGADAEECMVREAGRRRLPNVTWQQADARVEGALDTLGATDGILMRYVVLHLPDTRRTLPRMLAPSRPGTLLWVVDLDPDFTLCQPETPAFTFFEELVRGFCEKHATEIRTGTFLPPILESAGFEVLEVGVEPFNNQQIDDRVLAEYLFREATLYHHFLHGTHTSKKLDEMRRFFFDVMKRDTHFVQYGMAMVAACKR